MITITLNDISAHNRSSEIWQEVLRVFGTTPPDEPIAIVEIAHRMGLDSALLCLHAVRGHDREKHRYAGACARRVQPLMADPQSVAALDTTERVANGEATADDLAAAQVTALAAAREAAWSALAAKGDTSWRAWAAARAARAAWEATRADAQAAAENAAWATKHTAGETAWDAEREWQMTKFVEIFCLTNSNESEGRPCHARVL